MGFRGPAPKPTAVKKLLGNPGKRKLSKAEPMPEEGIPACPDHLDETAQKEWGRLVNILLAMRVLTEADYIALGTLCQSYATLITAQRQLNKTGLLIKTQSGYLQQSPLLGIITAQTTIVNKLMCEFGLTPASRTRLAVTPKPAEELDEIAMLAAEIRSDVRPN
jgi:P27 family predicted phage terminase small subunit